MGFVPISIDNYVKMHIENNPSENEASLHKKINIALKDFKNGVRCSCGNDIWVIGSASIGNYCFSCITGESYPKDDYEIDSAINKRESTAGRKHINEMDPTQIAGFFDDEGYEINMDMIEKPSLCILCINDGDPNEELFCKMTRYDQKDNEEFKCFAFTKKDK